MTAPDDQQLALAGRAVLEPIARSIMLQIVDAQWKDHLYSLDHLKEGIGLRGYGQRDPLVEYKKESFALFQGMKEPHRRGDGALPVAAAPGHRRPATAASRWPPRRAAAPAGRRGPSQLTFSDTKQPPPPPSAAFAAIGAAAALGARAAPAAGARRRRRRGRSRRSGATSPKVGRNDPCPCGSGKKYKKCHGANQ